MDKAVQRTIEIRSLPEKKYIHTLDDQDVLLSQFFQKCDILFPWCSLYRKFYYWENEVKTIKSSTPRGQLIHKIRCYHNCISTYCKHKCDLRKKYGDVAEYYDVEGKFMGLAVYVRQGKYCTLPYDGYEK